MHLILISWFILFLFLASTITKNLLYLSKFIPFLLFLSFILILYNLSVNWCIRTLIIQSNYWYTWLHIYHICYCFLFVTLVPCLYPCTLFGFCIFHWIFQMIPLYLLSKLQVILLSLLFFFWVVSLDFAIHLQIF